MINHSNTKKTSLGLKALTLYIAFSVLVKAEEPARQSNDRLLGLFDSIGDAFKNLGNQIADTATGVGNTVSNGVTGVGTDIFKVVTGVSSTVVDAAKDAGNGIVNIGNNGFNAASDASKNFVGELLKGTSEISKTYQQMQNLFKGKTTYQLLMLIKNSSSNFLTDMTYYIKSGSLIPNFPKTVSPLGAVIFGAQQNNAQVQVEGVVCYRFGDHDLVIYFNSMNQSDIKHGATIFFNSHSSAQDNFNKMAGKISSLLTPVRRSWAVANLEMYGFPGKIWNEIIVLNDKTRNAPMNPQNPRALTSYHNTQLRGYPEGKLDLTTNNLSWEKWTFIALPGGNNRFNIRSAHGSYLRGYPEGRVDLAPWAQSWEVWTRVPLTNGKAVWRSAHNTYLRGNPNMTVDLAQEPNDWEMWSD